MTTVQLYFDLLILLIKMLQDQKKGWPICFDNGNAVAYLILLQLTNQKESRQGFRCTVIKVMLTLFSLCRLHNVPSLRTFYFWVGNNVFGFHFNHFVFVIWLWVSPWSLSCLLKSFLAILYKHIHRTPLSILYSRVIVVIMIVWLSAAPFSTFMVSALISVY